MLMGKLGQICILYELRSWLFEVCWRSQTWKAFHRYSSLCSTTTHLDARVSHSWKDYDGTNTTSVPNLASGECTLLWKAWHMLTAWQICHLQSLYRWLSVFMWCVCARWTRKVSKCVAVGNALLVYTLNSSLGWLKCMERSVNDDIVFRATTSGS